MAAKNVIVFLNCAEVGREIGVSTATIFRWEAAGRIARDAQTKSGNPLFLETSIPLLRIQAFQPPAQSNVPAKPGTKQHARKQVYRR